MTREFTLSFKCDNAQFEDEGLESAIASILEDVAEHFKNDMGIMSGSVYDTNGNIIGYYDLKESNK